MSVWDDLSEATARAAEGGAAPPRGDRRVGAARQEGYRQGWEHGYQSGKADARGEAAMRTAAASVVGELDREFLRDLVRLTHPDRHPPERAGEANRLTAELLRRLRG